MQSYQRRLSNISGNNRSLLLLRLIANQTIDLHDFDFLDGKPSFEIIDHIIGRTKKIKLSQAIDSRDKDANQLTLRLKQLQRKAQFILDETGAFDLYVGWPFVHGKFADGSLVRSPLMFFPIRLTLEDNVWYLDNRAEVNISMNKSLLLAYAHYNEMTLEEELVERTFDDFDQDSKVFRTSLYELLRDSAIELNFNQDLFANELIQFKNYKKAEFQNEHKDGELKLYSEAVLGIFPQADSYLVPDYDYLLERDQFESLEAFFQSKTIENEDQLDAHSQDYTYFLNKVKEEQTFTPFHMDAYQENAIKAAKRGNSLVVQGPPGTGKSQLICNLISDYMARGKKVLVVCQKRAALDVVYARLKEKKLDDFTALVHDFKNDRKSIYEKIASQIDRLDEYQRGNNNLDTIQLERDFQLSSRAIDQITEELEEYRKALYDESECGVSVKELYLTSSPEEQSISLTQEYNQLPLSDLPLLKKELTRYFAYANQYNHSDHPWAERVNFAKFKLRDLQLIQESLKEIPSYAKSLVKVVSEIVDESVDYDSCRTLSENLDKLAEMIQYLKSQEIFELFRDMVPFQNDLTESLWLENTRKLINHCFDEVGIESTIPANEMGEIQMILKGRSSAKKSFLKSIKWSFSKEKTRLARVLIANGLRDDQLGLDMLTKRLDNRLNLQHQLTKLKDAGWIKVFPESQEQKEINDWFDKMDIALKAKLLFSGFTNFREYFNLQKFTAAEYGSKVKELITALKELPKKRTVWNKYILPRQIDLLLLSDEFYKQLKNRIGKDFDAICEFDKLKEAFSEAQLAVVDKLEELEGHSDEQLLAIFENSLRLSWIDHIESKYEMLRSVSTLKFDQMTEDLQAAVEKKLEVSGEILIQKTRENTYLPVEYNRLNNRVTYRDLHHQVTKKRKVWPIRRLLSHFSEELFHLVPCWMASPESVSAMFPMENFFDLVIFDEASQCFSEKGLPAAYRAKQVVITGDPMQLQPNDLYMVRWEDESEGIAHEVDSFLELCSKYLMKVDLKGHYRSKSIDLIQFSNNHFYKGNLSLLPHFEQVNDDSPGIEYRKVAGIWDKQTNEVEAEEITSLVKSLRKSKPESSIGIVTFNAPQQGLIQDTLESSGIQMDEQLFVKNIENVQGDEMDIIIFSIAYAPNPQGKMSVQFGSLNAAGGENRLNVAITRAREKVIVVTSIWPEELDVARAKHEGPKLLKDYLIYAKSVWEKKFVYEVPLAEHRSPAWYLKGQLKTWDRDYDFQFVEELPFSDLTIKKKKQYHGLILTDDDLYHGSPSEKETFVYKPSALTSKHWNYKLFHSRNHWLDKDKVREKLNRFLEDLDEQAS